MNEKDVFTPATRKPNERITATEARVHFGEIYRRVSENDELIEVERTGKPGVILLSIEEFKRLKQKAGEDESTANWWQDMVENAESFRSARGGRPIVDATELIREMREERHRHLVETIRGACADSSEPGDPPALTGEGEPL